MISLQTCFYFHLKFRNLNDKIKALLLLKAKRRNAKKIFRCVNLIIQEHNVICSRQHRFNEFWKIYLKFEIFNFIFQVWFFAYESIFDPKLVLFNKIFFGNWLNNWIIVLSCFIYMIYLVSINVFFRIFFTY